MTHTDYSRFLQGIDGLSPEQMVRLRREIDHRLATSAVPGDAATTPDQVAEQELQRRLFDAGLLSEIKPPRREATGPHRFTPVPIEGEPLSETIIRERR